ncbi:hypothetical protein L6452_07842 [Arctium lappa]|uniref:Uncharacterized protein n=1 Tax=Arctium lappa TaxID=4217 RepID=A0ACB9EMC0_ARCLA|nr:hypothetical protein L6452_07842 [Arctium lappa]
MDPPIGYPLRNQIVQRYIQTLASALDSEEEANSSMYSVSTKYYYVFGCKIDEKVVHRIKCNLCQMSDGFCRTPIRLRRCVYSSGLSCIKVELKLMVQESAI